MVRMKSKRGHARSADRKPLPAGDTGSIDVSLQPLLARILETLADPVSVQDRDFTIIYQNKGMREAFGNHRGEKCYESYERRSAVCEGCGLKTAMDTGKPVKILRTAILLDGTTAYWENACSAVTDDSGRVIALTEVCRNVADRLSLEDAFKATNIRLGQLTAQLEVKVAERTADLARSNLFLDTIIDSIGDPLFVKDEHFRWIRVNRALCDFAGLSRDCLLGKTDFDAFSAREARGFHQFDEEVLATEGELTREEWVTAADGTVRIALVKKTFFRDPGGNRNIVGIIRDVTEQRRMQEQLHQVQKMESIGMLAGGIAHDFNNLLTPIIGGADLLLLDPQDADRSSLVHDMRNAAERLRELTQRLLAFGRKQMLELHRVDLCDVVRRFEPMLRRTLRENVRLETDLAPGPHTALADAGQIEQVLLNLAVNAQDAMPGGGTLRIGVTTGPLDDAHARGHPEARPGQYVRISVADTGTGMDDQTRLRIFEPFFTTKSEGRGSGLGLAMVYGIIRQQGGTIDVTSAPGRGSTFTIYLPPSTDEDRPVSDMRRTQVTPLPRRPETILVLEDNDSVRTATCIMLQRLGYRVLSADGPESCMSVAGSFDGTIDLLLSDVVLSESNGREVFERLRAAGFVRKVVYMSGYTSEVVVHDGVLDKGTHFLQKPVTLAVLGAKVRQALDDG
jgi:two-component system, cell cycle sensor histidine kinase and response regulator CckA